ncbi:DUF5320 domain-containing protein [Ancylomarina sp.]|uniref:DUF5320 domain-containing protein n=1 Tax=Ancylomarina sp. TaxID=1970196 RepID=UPI003564066A
MPRLDRTGPEGKGSQTGRGLGKCHSKQEEIDQQAQNENQNRLAPNNTACGRGQRRRKRRGSC